LWKAAIEKGWRVERLQSHHPPDFLRECEVVIYGESIFANVIADELSIALLEPAFSWVADLPSVYRQRMLRFATLGEVRRIATPAFVKPAYDKSFEARVYDAGVELPSVDLLRDEVPVLIAEPVQWELEFRCFVLNREVVTLSPYLRNGAFVQTEEGTWPASQDEVDEALAFANRLLNDNTIAAPPGFVLDIGKIAGRGWAVVEANPAWASGVYGCDPSRVLHVLRRVCVSQPSDEDKRWVWKRTV
jgi:hypothetical protein